jgi:hypothetical protein
MNTVSFDTETHWMDTTGKATHCDTPPFVCLTWCLDGKDAHIEVDHTRAAELFMSWLDDEGVRVVAHNLPFDLGVMARLVWETRGVDVTPAIVKAYDQGRMGDTFIRAMLADIGNGGLDPRGYTLAGLVKRVFGHDVEGKSDPHAWRYRYAELDGLALAAWPSAAIAYAKIDAVWAWRLWEKLPATPNEKFQVACHFGLKMLQAAGYRVDLDWTQDLDDWYAQVEDEATTTLARFGVVRPNGSKDMKAFRLMFEDAWASIGEMPWLTDKGAVATDAKALDYLAQKGAGDRRLGLADGEEGPFAAYVRANRAAKFRSTYIQPLLEAATVGRPLVTSYNPLVATGRVSARGPNVTNFPARSKPAERGLRVQGPMIRGCFVPSPGRKLVGADYTAIEMVALAQVCINLGAPYRDLADAINAGDDLHLRVVAVALRAPYADVALRHKAGDKEVAGWRQIAKIANYSFPTGASADTFREMARIQGVDVSPEQAALVRETWLATWREIEFYTAHIARCRMGGHGSGYWIEQHGPNRKTQGWRVRTTDRFTEAANTPFQGLVADAAKYAVWITARACFVDEASPLFGVARPWLFCHDELILEVDEEHADMAAEELSRIMVDCAKIWMPDVRVEANPQVFEHRWTK